MKKLLVFLCAVALIFGAVGAASAYSVTATYTGDNVLGAWWQQQDGASPTVLGTNGALGANYNNWEVVDSQTISGFFPGDTYSIIWQTINEKTPSSTNPGGFLGQIVYDGNTDLSSSSWEIAVQNGSTAPSDFTTLTFNPATTYGANNNSGTIWYSVNGGGPVADIADSAQWIWGSANFADPGAPGPNDSVFVKATFTVPKTDDNSVPEPATMLLVGSGLIGLAVIGRKFIKS